MNCKVNISLHFVTLSCLVVFVKKNLFRSRVVPCHVLIILFLAGRLYCGGFQTFETEQILALLRLLFVWRLEITSCSIFFFWQELTSDEFLLRFVTRCQIFTTVWLVYVVKWWRALKLENIPFNARFVGFRLINRKIKFVQIWSTVAGYGEFCVCL